MNEPSESQFHLDFRTGRPTAIPGPGVTGDVRSACAALNRERVRGLTEADRQTASRESIPPDVWAATFAQRCHEWAVPLIHLSALGISHTDERLLHSSFLAPLKSGAEACPFWDQDWGVVYKLFPLLDSGGLGKTFTMDFGDGDAEHVEVTTHDASLMETIDKLWVLSEAGALPTEIVGLASTGDYLIVKQPLAQPYQDFETDREIALQQIKAVPCVAPIRRNLWMIWHNDLTYLVSDLHKGNIMRDATDTPAVIDALFCPISHAVVRQRTWLMEAWEDARHWRIHGQKPVRKAFDDVDDSAL